jgi:hypothetical protein
MRGNACDVRREVCMTHPGDDEREKEKKGKNVNTDDLRNGL